METFLWSRRLRRAAFAALGRTGLAFGGLVLFSLACGGNRTSAQSCQVIVDTAAPCSKLTDSMKASAIQLCNFEMATGNDACRADAEELANCVKGQTCASLHAGTCTQPALDLSRDCPSGQKNSDGNQLVAARIAPSVLPQAWR